MQLVSRRLDFSLHLGHDFCGHDFAELGLNHLLDRVFGKWTLLLGVFFSLRVGLPLLQTQDVLLNSGQQALAQLLLKQLLLLEQQRSNGIFDLLLDHLGQDLLDRFGDGLLNGDLEVFLRLHLLLQRVHLHVQIRELPGQLLEVFDQQFLLAFARLRHRHIDR